MISGALRRLTISLAIGCGMVAASCTLLLDDDLSSGRERAPDAASPFDSAPPSDVLTGEADTSTPEEIGNGTGKNGPLNVSGETVVNSYAALEKDAPVGAKAMEIASAMSWAAGDLVLVWETTGFTNASGADSTPIDLTSHTSPVGRYELSRVKTIDGKQIGLEEPLAASYRAGNAQVVRVPEHTDVTITGGGRLKSDPWDGSRGGVVAVLATGTITIDGSLAVDGAGFRGGRAYRNTSFSSCPNLDGIPATGYAAKGEGIVPSGYSALLDAGDSPGGRGVFANGGGGGNCHNGGGGGGANGGAGGKGGRTFTSSNKADLGGYGGRAIIAPLDVRLIAGGGGGSGDAEDSPGESSSPGGAGGGVVFLRAATVLVLGSLSANGASATDGDDNGGGGGGAGGSVIIRATTRIACSGVVSARGGDGSNISGQYTGPGGGGGGGRIGLSAPMIECSPSVTGGAAGLGAPGDSGFGPTYGAVNGSDGTIVTTP